MGCTWSQQTMEPEEIEENETERASESRSESPYLDLLIKEEAIEFYRKYNNGNYKEDHQSIERSDWDIPGHTRRHLVNTREIGS